MKLEVTEWIPCETPPARTGWYEVQRRMALGNRYGVIERVFYEKPGGWDISSCASGKTVWPSTDIWRGVKQSKEG